MERLLAAVNKTTVISTVVAGMKYIGTHHGTFHCDEALACALLKLLPQFQSHVILRSRDQSLLDQCDIVVDVGGVFDSKTLRFDHHQKSFVDVFGGKFSTIKLSSAGLVYRHFGKEIISGLSKEPISDDLLEKVYLKVYKSFIEHIDGIDNGINAFNGGEQVYTISTSLSNRVSRLNPSWLEDSSSELENTKFKSAVILTGNEFIESVNHLIDEWLPARKIVEESMSQRFDIDPSGEIIVLNQFCPFQGHLFDIEEENTTLAGVVKYAIFADSQRGYRVRCIPESNSSFQSRKALPLPWRAFREEELSKVCGVEKCVFVHGAGFIGGNDTKEGAIKMAQLSLSFV